jgi:hypothetical protein
VRIGDILEGIDGSVCAQFACFTGAKVQILRLYRRRARR